MRSDALEQLRALDPEVLANVVRLDQRTKSFQMLDWTVERLSTRGIINPDGLFCFSGHGRDEHMTRSWSVVLKVLRRNDECESIRDLRYWKRELLASQFKLLQKLPGPVTAPRLYAATENAGGAWLWMEH